MSEHDTDKGHDSYKNRELAAAAIIHRSISPVPTTSASPDGISSPTLATALNLTAHQKQLLVQSWPEVHTYNRIHGGDAIFARFCEKNSIGRETFQKIAVVQSFAINKASESVLRKHEQYLLQLLSKAVENLNNDCEPLLKECLAYGAQHTTLQVLLDETVWDQLAEAVIERIHMLHYLWRRYEKDTDDAPNRFNVNTISNLKRRIRSTFPIPTYTCKGLLLKHSTKSLLREAQFVSFPSRAEKWSTLTTSNCLLLTQEQLTTG